MIYAQILNGLVINIIVLDDPSLSDVFKQGYDYLIPIENLNPIPKLGWLYDGTNFSPPIQEI